MIVTVTLFDYLNSVFENSGHNEFSTCDELTGFNNNKSNMTRLVIYDEIAQKICNESIFLGFELENKEYDVEFKKSIIARFLNRAIKFQTVDIFRAMFLGKLYSYKRKIDVYYDEYYKLLTSQSNNVSDSVSIGTSDNISVSKNNGRNATTTVPQNQVNLDLEKPYMEYADNNNISLNKSDTNTKNDNKNTTDTKSQGNNFNVEVFYKLNMCIEDLLNELDKTCFSQVA